MCRYHKDLFKTVEEQRVSIKKFKEAVYRQEQLLKRCLKLFDYVCVDCEYSPEFYSAMETLSDSIHKEIDQDFV